MIPNDLAVVKLVHIVARRFRDDRCLQIASSLTYTTLLSLVPLITVALTVIAAFPVFRETTAALQTFIFDNLMPESADVLATYAQQFTSNAARLTAVGIGFLAVTSIMLLITIDRAFNAIWRVKRPRAITQRVFVYWALITIGPVLFGGSLTLTSWLVGQAVGLVASLPGAGVVLLSIVPPAVTSFALALMYVAVPNRRIAFRDGLVGGCVAGIAFEAMKRGFVLYVAEFPTYKLVYGAFATLPVFLLWIYLSWLVVIFGAVVVAALPEWRSGAGQHAPARGGDFFDGLQILKMLWHAHRRGENVTFPDLLQAATVRIENVEAILESMTGAGWVRRAVPNDWVLHRDASTITVEDVFRLFVFQAETHLPGREADAHLESFVHEISARIGEHMRLPLSALFSAAEKEEALPVDVDQPSEMKSVRNVTAA